MVANIYKEITQYEDVGGDLVEKLREMNVYKIFELMDKAYCDDYSKFNKVLFYILHLYSVKSKFHILGADWLTIKQNTAEYVGIDAKETDVIYHDAVLMKSSEVVITIQRYLEYQGNRGFKHLCMLKDLYEQMVSSSVDRILKSSGEVDYDQKFKNHDYAAKLYSEINEWEQRVANDNKDLKHAFEEVEYHKKSSQLSLRVEDNLTPPTSM